MEIHNINKPTILVDMDDTLVNLLQAWVSALNQIHGLNVDPNDIDDWDITQFFPSLTRYQVFEPLFADEFWDTVKPKEDAVQYLKQLKDDGYKIYICTNTHYKTLKAKMEKVLFKYFDYLSWKDLIIVADKQLLDADFLVDDGVHNLIGGKYKGILMDAPHNRKFNEREHGIIRVKTWREIYALIKSMAE